MGKEKGLIEIRIAGLNEGVYTYTFTFHASDFVNPDLSEPELCNEIRASVVLNKTDNDITADIETTTVAELSCDICLAPLKRTLTGQYRVFFVFGDPVSDIDEHEENYRVLDRNTVSVDLTEDVRETLLLSKPMKTVCIDNPECSMYLDSTDRAPDNESDAKSPWKESLAKLKNKYH